MPRSEYGGTSSGSQRPDGTVQHPGQSLSMPGTLSPKDRARSLRLTGNDQGDEPIDLDWKWRGLDREAYADFPEDHNRLTDP